MIRVIRVIRVGRSNREYHDRTLGRVMYGYHVRTCGECKVWHRCEYSRQIFVRIPRNLAVGTNGTLPVVF